MIQIHPIRGALGFCHLVTETRATTTTVATTTTRALLIDTCPGCTPKKLSSLFACLNLRPADLCAIQLTHAHIDHCINTSAIQHWSGAPVYCPAADKPCLLEHAHYRSLNKIGGALEAIGRFFWRYKPPSDVRYFDPTPTPALLPHFDSLQTLSLPGHTPGHTGYYIPSINTLIAGDLFARVAGLTHAPPRIFTDDRREALRSIAKAAALNPANVYICHTPRADGPQGSATLRRLAARHTTIAP
jgi:glyoxylase-like metal-dependent hydrolase (beta-lactamase superfamily II)